MPAYERINAVVSITLIGLALYFVLDFPAQSTTFMLFGTPLNVDAPRQWLMMLLLGGMDLFDSVCHSFTSMATGGYSTKQASIAFYTSPYIQYVFIFFMF